MTKTSINFLFWGSDGHVIVDIGTSRYHYFTDAALLPHLRKLSRRAPGRALNALKKITNSYEKEEETKMERNVWDVVNEIEPLMNDVGYTLFRQGKSIRAGRTDCREREHGHSGLIFYRWVKRNRNYRHYDRLQVVVVCWKCSGTGNIEAGRVRNYDPKDYKQMPYHKNRLAVELNGLRYYHFK